MGNKESEENYKDGKLDGLSTVWYENGNKKTEEVFKDGELVEVTYKRGVFENFWKSIVGR